MKRITIALLALLIVAATPGAALAQEDPSTTTSTVRDGAEAARAEAEAAWLDAVKARALEAIEKRLTTLANLEDAIATSASVQPDHAGALMEDIRFSVAGLQALAVEIRAAEDVDTLRVLIPKIFEDYRIYAVVVPKVHLTLAADAAVAVAGRLESLAGSIDEILDRLDEAGYEVEDAEDLLEQMMDYIASGAAGAGDVPDMVLDLEPSDYPDSTAVVRSAHEQLQEAGGNLRAAGETAHKIGELIRALFADD